LQKGTIMLSSLKLATALSILLASAALAGPQYVDSTRFAASGYDVVAYFSLPQAAIGQPQPAAVPGHAAHTATYNGATFAFATAANRDLFVADPARFAPQYDGHCAYGAAKGSKVPGNPNLWRVVDGKLYLNITPAVVEDWEEDVPGHIATANEYWQGGLEADAASTDDIPRFTSAAPLN
jgi:YHS domain-containing protein